MWYVIGDIIYFLAKECSACQVIDIDLLPFGVADDNALVAGCNSCRGSFFYRVNGMGVAVALKIGRIDDIFGHLDCTLGIGHVIAPADEMIAVLGCGAECGKMILTGGVLADGNRPLAFVDALNHQGCSEHLAVVGKKSPVGVCSVVIDAVAGHKDLKVAVDLVKDIVAQFWGCGGIAGDAMELIALGENSVAKRCQSAWQGNPGQSLALGKGIAFNGGDIGGNVKAYNAAAATEGGISDSGKSVAQTDASKVVASVEGHLVDKGDGVGDGECASQV